MPPRRRDDDEAGPSGRGGSAAVHRYAFTQHLLKQGCLPETRAKEVFQRLTGSDSGEGVPRGAGDAAACVDGRLARRRGRWRSAAARASRFVHPRSPLPTARHSPPLLPAPPDDAYRRMVADQNRDLAALHLQIRTMKYPIDQQRYVGLINSVSTHACCLCASRMQAAHAPHAAPVLPALQHASSFESGIRRLRQPQAVQRAAGSKQAAAAHPSLHACTRPTARRRGVKVWHALHHPRARVLPHGGEAPGPAAKRCAALPAQHAVTACPPAALLLPPLATLFSVEYGHLWASNRCGDDVPATDTHASPS